MVHVLSLLLVGFNGVKHGNLNVAVADDNPEETGLVPVKLGLMLLGSLHTLPVSAPLFHAVYFGQPPVMLGFEVYRADIPRASCVLSAPFK